MLVVREDFPVNEEYKLLLILGLLAQSRFELPVSLRANQMDRKRILLESLALASLSQAVSNVHKLREQGHRVVRDFYPDDLLLALVV